MAAIIVLALPGFIYAAIRRWARGEQSDDRNVGLLFARGLAFTVSLCAVYFLVGGGALAGGLDFQTKSGQVSVTDVRVVAGVVLLFFVIVPALAALVLVRDDLRWETPDRPEWWPKWKWARVPHSRHNYISVPTSWDHGVRANTDGSWVKIRRDNKYWVGGWFTKGSHATTYPEPESIYIAEQYAMTEEGNFGEPIPGAGVWLKVNPSDIVIWISSNETKLKEQ